MSAIVFDAMIRVAGTLTNADSTPTITIVRLDSNATVVATTSTGVTNPSTGTYQYTLSSPVAGVVYRATWAITLSGQTFSYPTDRIGPRTGMTLTAARAVVRQFVRSGGDSDRYSNTDIDNAILLVGNDFVKRTRCTLTKSSVTLTADDEDVDFSGLSGFKPTYLFSVAVDVTTDYTDSDVRCGMDECPADDIAEAKGCSTSSSTPAKIAFTSWTDAIVWPKPKAAGTMSVWWAEPFVAFTAGTASPDSVTLNIPVELLHPVLIYGAAVILQLTEVEQIEKALRMGAYGQHVTSSMGSGSISGKGSTGRSLR